MTPGQWFFTVIGVIFFLVTTEFWLAVIIGLLWIFGVVLNSCMVLIGEIIVGLMEFFVAGVDDTWHCFKDLPKSVRNSIATFAVVAVVFISISYLAYFFR